MATIDIGRKEGHCCAPFAGKLGPRLTQCGLGRGLLPDQVTSSSIHAFGHNRHEPKTGLCPFFGGEAATPSNTTSPGPRFTSAPCSILIHPAVWPQWTCAKNCAVPFFLGGEGGWVPIHHKVAWAEAYHIPSGILVHPAVSPQQTLAENWGAVPLLGRGSWITI